MIDVTIAWWGGAHRGVAYHEPMAAAMAAEGRKDRAYAGAMGRNSEHQFVALAFEATGAWGPTARWFFRLCVGLAERRRGAAMWHWSAMTFRKHWRQRIGVTLGKGRAVTVTAAAAHRRDCSGYRGHHFID